MTTIASMLRKFQSLDLRSEVPRIIEQTSPIIEKLNKSQLYEHSVDRDGEPLRLYASLSYALEKNRRNPKPGFGRPDLFNEGSFFAQFFTVVGSNTFETSSRDSKTSGLVAKYSADIFGLTKENKSKYANETLFEGIKSYIITKTGVGFS